MHVMTEDGWRMLKPPVVNQVWELSTFDEKTKTYVTDKERGKPRLVGFRTGLPSPAEERGAYTGELPSEAIVDFYNRLKEKLKYFDDGVRMVYGKPDKIVEVDNAVPEHPMAHPPAGWVFSHNTGTFVLRRSKYE